MKASVNIKDLRFIEKARVPVRDLETGERVDSLEYNEVGGVILVPLKDAPKFGLSTWTLREKIKDGTLQGYNVDGSRRAANAKTEIYWDLREFYNKS